MNLSMMRPMTTCLYPKRRREERAVVVNKKAKKRRVVRERRKRGEGINQGVANSLRKVTDNLSPESSLC